MGEMCDCGEMKKSHHRVCKDCYHKENGKPKKIVDNFCDDVDYMKHGIREKEK